MKEITETVLTHLLAAIPNAKVEIVDGVKTVKVPIYEIETDRSWVETKRVIPDPETTPVGILPVFNIRKGPKFNPDGEPKVSPLGHLYRIIGYTPPPKDDAE
jgi:hypothetical protein